MLPFGGRRSDAGFVTVGEDDDGVVPEELGDGGLVVTQVVVVGVFGGFGERFELDEDEGETVDETDEIGTFGIGIASNSHLGGEEEIVVGGAVPVDDADDLDALAALGIGNGDLDAIAQEIPEVVVGVDGVVGGTVLGELGDGLVDGGGREVGVESGKGGSEAGGQDDIVPGFAAERVGGSAELVEAGLGLPSEVGEERDGWLFDEGVFGIIGLHPGTFVPVRFCRSRIVVSDLE